MKLKSQIIGSEFYREFDQEKANQLIKKLDGFPFEWEETIKINEEEKMILFEIMRASSQLNCPGNTIAYEDFDRTLLTGQLKWGKNTFELVKS